VAFQHYLAHLVAERKKNPQDDLISTLPRFSTPGEEPLTETELVIMLQGLILAGHESTTNMIGTGLLLLLEQPEHWRTLCEHPETIPLTVEEILRFDAPIQMFARTTTREVTLDGVMLPEEASLLLIYGSGNRDEEAFAGAHEFQPQRVSNRHLAFGHGVHFVWQQLWLASKDALPLRSFASVCLNSVWYLGRSLHTFLPSCSGGMSG